MGKNHASQYANFGSLRLYLFVVNDTPLVLLISALTGTMFT